MNTLVFDTGPLSHFARAGLLDALKSVVGERSAVIPEAVEKELREGVHQHPSIQSVLDADWIEVRKLDSVEELAAFAKYAERLVSGKRNIGEAAALGLAETPSGCAVVDDGVAHKVASRHVVSVKRTLALLCQAIRDGVLTIDTVSSIADELIETDYRSPFEQREFARWAAENDQLPT